MDAGKKKINDIINGNRQLVIPFFQRSYVWKEDLWERFLESMEEVSKSGKEYFLGSIILKQLQTSSSETIGDVRTVIDGQQRLTTLALFLKVLCSMTNDELMFEKMFKLRQNRHAIVHNMFDKEVFDEIIDQKELKELSYDSRLAKAYNFFIKNVKPENLNIDTILAHVSLIGIDLNHEDDEQVIFDTINSIGVTLTTGELLKNYLFSQDSIEAYNAKWKPIFEADEDTVKYWDSGITQGRLLRKNLDIFLNAYLHIKINDPIYGISSQDKEVRHDDLFNQYKEFIAKSTITFEDLIDDLTIYAKLYREYLTPQILDEEIPGTYGLERLNLIIFALDATTVIPYLLYLLRNQSDKEEINRICRILESYLMRRIVCKSNTNNYSDLFSQSLIGSQYLFADALKDYLLAKEEDSSLAMPDDATLIYAFEENVLLNVRSKGVLYLIESMIRSERHSTALKSFNSYSLEHLMPKKWRPQTWPIDDLSKSEERNRALKTLGNLALLTQSLNSSISNSSWEVKLNGNSKKKGLKEYAVGLDSMRYVLDQPQWDEMNIKKRSEFLFDCARVIWNFEDVEFESSSQFDEEQEVLKLEDPMERDDSPESLINKEKKIINSNNDRTQFSLDGGRTFMHKNRFVHAGIQRYIELFPAKSFVELKSVFKDSFLNQFKRLGFLCSEADLAKPLTRGRKPTENEIRRWYFMKENEWLTAGDGIKFVVSTQITLASANKVRDILEAEGIAVQTTK